MHVYLFILVYQMIDAFLATLAACSLLDTYFDKVPDEVNNASGKCTLAFIAYLAWILISIVVTIVRCISLFFMAKAWRFLDKKRIDKEKRAARLKEKKKKLKRLKKREI